MSEKIETSTVQVDNNNKPIKNRRPRQKRGYVYIGHLPHGFFEQQIKDYFKQFGKVRRVRLSRSKKTGNCRGFGFIEFENESVAKIAADTMNNYLMFNKILKCQQIERDKIHRKAFKNSHRLFVKPIKSWFRKSYNSKKSKKQIEKSKKNLKQKLNKKQKKLEELGLDINIKSLINGEEAQKAEETVSVKKTGGGGKKRKNEETEDLNKMLKSFNDKSKEEKPKKKVKKENLEKKVKKEKNIDNKKKVKKNKKE